MERLKEGDIVFIDSKTWLSRMIQIVTTASLTKRVPSHVAIVSSIYSNTVVITEATLKGVIQSDLNIYYGKVLYVKRMREPRDIYKGLVWLNSELGRGYDYMQLFGILGRSFWRLFGDRVYNRSKRIRNLLDSKTRFICSELVEVFASVTGKRLWHGSIGFVTPADLNRSELLDTIDFSYFDN